MARRYLVVVIAVACAFFATWWNRYAPPTAGGEVLLMAPWAADFLPYRDYFTQAPPGIPILLKAIAAIAGPHLLATLTFGVLLRTAGACALYALLLAIARPSFAALATLAALFVSSTDGGDTPFYYNHVGTSLVLIGTYLAVAGAKGTRAAHYLMTAGGAALILYAVAVKQTMVFGAAAALLALVVLVFPRPRAGWLAWSLALVAGAACTVAGIWVWLASHDLARSFLFVMRRAPEGKGGLWRSLFRPVLLLIHLPGLRLPTLIAGVVFGAGLAVWGLYRRGSRVRRDVALVLAAAATLWMLTMSVWSGRFGTFALTALGWWGSLAVAAMCVGSLARRRPDAFAQACLALAVLSFGIGYCFAVSWPLFENMAFPGLALVIVVALECAPSRIRRLWVTAVVVLAIGAMCLSVERKFSDPHNWGLWVEPPLYAPRARVDHPSLAGMRASQPAAELYATVARVARQYTRSDDRIFVYPNMAILYAIAGRRPATYALVHWVDTCPDFLGREDAARLRANPPKLMIIRQDPIEFTANEERSYRGGRRSSVRDVVDAVADLAPGYDRVGTLETGVSAPIVFLVRRDAPR